MAIPAWRAGGRCPSQIRDAESSAENLCGFDVGLSDGLADDPAEDRSEAGRSDDFVIAVTGFSDGKAAASESEITARLLVFPMSTPRK